MTLPPDPQLDAVRLRAALLDHLEHVMTDTDTERELARFRASVSPTGTRRRVLAAAAAVAVLGAAVGGLLVLREDRSATLPAAAGGSGAGLTGSMLLESRNVDGNDSDATRQEEFRGVSLTGPVTLRTEDGERTGSVDFTNNAGGVTGVAADVLHSWGAGTITLDDTVCRGSWGFSHYREPPEGGGSLHLACDDGSVLGATLVAQSIAPNRLTGIFEVDLRLVDGFFIEG